MGKDSKSEPEQNQNTEPSVEQRNPKSDPTRKMKRVSIQEGSNSPTITIATEDGNRSSDKVTSVESSVTIDASSSKHPLGQERVKDATAYFNDGLRVIDLVLAYQPILKASGALDDSKEEQQRQSYRTAFEKKLEQIGVALEYEGINEENIKVEFTWSVVSLKDTRQKEILFLTLLVIKAQIY